MLNKTETKIKEQPVLYYCSKCNRFTDVHYLFDKQGGRLKSYCYKCSDEMLEPVEIGKMNIKRRNEEIE